MYNLGEQFKVGKNSIANPKSIVKGDKYRITLLSDSLLRLEYSENGIFEDRATEHVFNRKFEVPKFEVMEDASMITIVTEFYKVFYIKNTPFKGSRVNPASNLKVEFLENLEIKLETNIQSNKVFQAVTEIPDRIHIISSGVQIGEIKNNYIYPNHYLFSAYGKYFKNKCNLTINDERVLKYLKGEEIEANVPNGWGVITVEGYPLGGYKATNGKLKNHYPKGLRNICK